MSSRTNGRTDRTESCCLPPPVLWPDGDGDRRRGHRSNYRRDSPVNLSVSVLPRPRPRPAACPMSPSPLPFDPARPHVVKLNPQMSVGVERRRWGCFWNSYPECRSCRTQQRERSTIEESRKRVLRLRFKFVVIVGNDSGGVFVSIMNGLISRRRRLHNPEIDVTTDDGRSDCCRNSGPSTRVARGPPRRRSFVNSSSGSMITGWTPIHQTIPARERDCDNG